MGDHRTSRPVRATAVAAVALALVASGCSSTGGRKAVEESERSFGKAGTPHMTVALISHSAPGDTFWDIVRKGGQDAAQKDNATLQYSADPEGDNQANLVQQAIDKKVDGIAVTLSKPDSMRPVIQKAVRAGIPVVVLNGGLQEWKKLGVLGYYGMDDRLAGQQAGQKVKAGGGRKPLCVIHEQGNVDLQARCAGVKQAVPSTQLLYVNGASSSAMQSAITSKLQQDPSIDRVVTLGGPIAMTAVQSKKDSQSKAQVVTFDVSSDVLQAIKDGDIAWAVDQQPYLQGYLAVDQLWLQKTNGNVVGGGQPVLTGPAFVDRSNVAKVEKFAKSGRR